MYLMGWGSAVVGLGKAIVVGIFWILQKFGWNLWQSLQDRSALRELCAPEELEAVNHASSVLASSCYLHGGSSVLGHFPFSVVPASFHVPEEQGCVPCRGWSPANKKKVSPFPRTVSTLLKTEVSQESSVCQKLTFVPRKLALGSDFRSFFQTAVLQNFWREQPETILWLLCALPLWIKWADITH